MTLDNNISVDIDRRGDDDAAGAAEEPAPTEAAGAADASDAVNAADAIDTDDAVDAADAPEAIDTGDAVDAADAIDTPGPIDADETSTINAAGDEVAVALDPSAELIDVVDLDDAQAAAPVEPSP